MLIALVLILLFVQIGRGGESPQLASVREYLARLAPVAQAVQDVRVDLADLRATARARQDLDRQAAESIRRLEMIIAGTQSRGAAGENILEVVFGTLPAEWQVRNLRIGDRVVEFGLRLPNNLVLPIDSKWAGVALLEQLAACEEHHDRARLKAQIEATVLERGRELRKYIDPNVTVAFGVATVPDAVFDLCMGIQADLFRQSVVLVPYSMFVPYLLLVFQTTAKMSQTIDLHQLSTQLESAERSVQAIQEELNGRFSRALTMLSNSRDEIAVHMARATAGLTRLRLSTPSADENGHAGELPTGKLPAGEERVG